MKQPFRTVALIAVLGMVATGCMKEPMVEPQMAVANENTSVCIAYTVDGETHLATVANEEEWRLFLNIMIAWAEEGRTVSFCDTETITNVKQGREIITFTTKDEGEAGQWAEERRSEGYKVYISFDPNTGIFTCTAVK